MTQDDTFVSSVKMIYSAAEEVHWEQNNILQFEHLVRYGHGKDSFYIYNALVYSFSKHFE